MLCLQSKSVHPQKISVHCTQATGMPLGHPEKAKGAGGGSVSAAPGPRTDETRSAPESKVFIRGPYDGVDDLDVALSRPCAQILPVLSLGADFRGSWKRFGLPSRAAAAGEQGASPAPGEGSRGCAGGARASSMASSMASSLTRRDLNQGRGPAPSGPRACSRGRGSSGCCGPSRGTTTRQQSAPFRSCRRTRWSSESEDGSKQGLLWLVEQLLSDVEVPEARDPAPLRAAPDGERRPQRAEAFPSRRSSWRCSTPIGARSAPARTSSPAPSVFSFLHVASCRTTTLSPPKCQSPGSSGGILLRLPPPRQVP